jgi:hypothetical protein
MSVNYIGTPGTTNMAAAFRPRFAIRLVAGRDPQAVTRSITAVACAIHLDIASTLDALAASARQRVAIDVTP